MTITSFLPPQRTLMGPGPSDIHPRVLQAMSRPTIGHLDPRFIDMMDEVKSMLQYAFRTKNALTMPVSAPGAFPTPSNIIRARSISRTIHLISPFRFLDNLPVILTVGSIVGWRHARYNNRRPTRWEAARSIAARRRSSSVGT